MIEKNFIFGFCFKFSFNVIETNADIVGNSVNRNSLKNYRNLLKFTNNSLKKLFGKF